MKEPFMIKMNNFIEDNSETFYRFLDGVVAVEGTDVNAAEIPSTVRYNALASLHHYLLHQRAQLKEDLSDDPEMVKRLENLLQAMGPPPAKQINRASNQT
jgi:hypothetical protein